MGKLLWTERQDIGPTARDESAMTYDATRQQVTLFGGWKSGGGALNDTWVWDGQLWTQSQDIGPPARANHALAFDSVRARIVLFGGIVGDPFLPKSPTFADTWEWDGTEWTQTADTGPSARGAHALTFDSKNKRVVLFGGQSSNIQVGDTWSWDGVEWTQEDETGPAARFFHAMAYDAIRNRVVLFGGFGTVNDTWEWDGSHWSQVADTGPAARYGHGMVFDGTRVLLFGGATRSSYFGDTWSWDGKHWTQTQDIGPAPRIFAAMGYDSDRSRTVLFGGSNPARTTFLGDTWELYDHS